MRFSKCLATTIGKVLSLNITDTDLLLMGMSPILGY